MGDNENIIHDKYRAKVLRYHDTKFLDERGGASGLKIVSADININFLWAHTRCSMLKLLKTDINE